MAQAEKLLKTYGPDKVNFIIDYAIRKAERTNFHMQTFGAIQQYVPEALKAYDRMRQDEEQGARVQAEREEADRREAEELKKAEELLEGLALEERQALYDEVKNDLVMKYPLVNNWKPDVIEGTIKARMIARLRQKIESSTH